MRLTLNKILRGEPVDLKDKREQRNELKKMEFVVRI